MSNQETAMEEAVAKAISETKEWHHVDKESFERRMEAEWRERFEKEKARMRATVENQPLLFEKEEEEVKCDDSGVSFVACAEDEKARVVQ